MDGKHPLANAFKYEDVVSELVGVAQHAVEYPSHWGLIEREHAVSLN